MLLGPALTADIAAALAHVRFPPKADIARHALARDSGVPALVMADYMDDAKCLGGRC
jgi:hypothetical protein